VECLYDRTRQRVIPIVKPTKKIQKKVSSLHWVNQSWLSSFCSRLEKNHPKLQLNIENFPDGWNCWFQSPLELFGRGLFPPQLIWNFTQKLTSLKSFRTVLTWLRKLKVKKPKFDRYRCIKCFHGLSNPSSVQFQTHISLVHSQWDYFKTLQGNLSPSEILLIFDY